MATVHRVLPPEPVSSLADHVRRRGGRGLDNARAVEPVAIIDELEAAGLRGRGGAGFPTHLKWRAVVEHRSDVIAPTVVVNGAEGEPGTFKDRTILLRDPYTVLEGALIAARAVGADGVVFGLKASAPHVTARVRSALAEMEAAGWTDGVSVELFEGPDEYLYGEETALLEALHGRAPLPRLAPPFRRGVDEVVAHPDDVVSGSGQSAHVDLAEPDNVTGAPPAVVDNVETLANVPGILARGGSWFRTEGTDESPGTIVCTVTGSVRHAGVAEFMMGTPLREVIDTISGGAIGGRRIVGVLPGVSNPIITADQLDTPLSYEGMAAIGSGLGSAGFIVLDDHDDPVASIAGVSRFLAVESCGQCTPCKQDGLSLSAQLEQLCQNDADEATIDAIRVELDRVTDGARCYLATQQQAVVGSLFTSFAPAVEAHLQGTAPAVDPTVVAELRLIDDGRAEIDLRHADKQPDWTFDPVDSGQAPADRLGEHRTTQALDG